MRPLTDVLPIHVLVHCGVIITTFQLGQPHFTSIVKQNGRRLLGVRHCHSVYVLLALFVVQTYVFVILYYNLTVLNTRSY